MSYDKDNSAQNNIAKTQHMLNIERTDTKSVVNNRKTAWC